MTKEEIIQALEDLQKRVEKIEKETMRDIKNLGLFLFLWWTISNLIPFIWSFFS